ncbi:MAG: 3-keto-disaccharide hydrolase [Opitutaceae bacterium]
MNRLTRGVIGIRTLMCAGALCLVGSFAGAEELISGQVLENFQKTKHWHLVDRVSLSDEDAGNFKSSPNARGKILLNGDARVKRLPYLLTKKSYGDVEVTLEFMIPKGSNAGIYLMGRYEVQIFDSYGKKEVKFSDIGGIYEEWARKGVDIGDRPLYAGSAPLVNAAKAPGEWQRLDIRFRAPRFNSEGEKIEDARFLSVQLNGQLVQKEVSVPAPTVSNPIQGEAETGPVSIQGDHGPVAIRSFVVKPLSR